jgi:23S rRNA (cytosine1962-C5)-methyltransferase
MFTIQIECPNDLTSYKLLDSGDGQKLEMFSGYTVVRPDPRAIWSQHTPEIWSKADAVYERLSQEAGQWIVKKPAPDPWIFQYNSLSFKLKPTDFKHVGVFPEQAVNWKWMAEYEDMHKKQETGNKQKTLLNLFGYTGAATTVAASLGYQVTHVDASKPSLDWAHENINANHLESMGCRWILDDVGKFVTREIKRGNTYDAIIMDPPRFGRGAKGEVWKLLTDLPELLRMCSSLLSPSASFLIVNAYTADISAITLYNLMESIFGSKGGSITTSEVGLKEEKNNRILPNGMVGRWSK